MSKRGVVIGIDPGTTRPHTAAAFYYRLDNDEQRGEHEIELKGVGILAAGSFCEPGTLAIWARNYEPDKLLEALVPVNKITAIVLEYPEPQGPARPLAPILKSASILLGVLAQFLLPASPPIYTPPPRVICGDLLGKANAGDADKLAFLREEYTETTGKGSSFTHNKIDNVDAYLCGMWLIEAVISAAENAAGLPGRYESINVDAWREPR